MSGPLRYPVEIHNDDKTPFSVVVQIINELFGYSRDEAVALTEQVDQEGSAVLGEFLYEIAETKVSEVQQINKLNDLDVQITIDTSQDKTNETSVELTEEMIQSLLDELMKRGSDDEED
ncbi:ribosomal protein L7/L12/ClpS-like adaptor protein [Vibrio phage 2.275.O._10N.286.54.E11]|nr:ribosomal protein L7/L12/ClpS-like adaptor protein [Vibrio phage 2.275.O._10N.286.54.E11]